MKSVVKCMADWQAVSQCVSPGVMQKWQHVVLTC